MKIIAKNSKDSFTTATHISESLLNKLQVFLADVPCSRVPLKTKVKDVQARYGDREHHRVPLSISESNCS